MVEQLLFFMPWIWQCQEYSVEQGWCFYGTIHCR